MKQKYQLLVNQTIPISQALGWQILHLERFQISTQTRLAPNINIHGTGFAGSLFAAAMATGWTLLRCWSDSYRFESELVAAEANIKYLEPVTHDFRCRGKINTETDEYLKLFRRSKERRNLGYKQTIEIECQSQVCAILNIQFVFTF